jgi:hypothetical protein
MGDVFMRNWLVGLALVAGLGSPAAASDDGKVQGLEDVNLLGLGPGTRFVLQIDDAGRVTVAPAGAPQLSNLDQNVAKQIADTYGDPEKLAEASGPNATMIDGGNAKAQPIPKDVIRVSFFELTGSDGKSATLLVFENGYDRALRYKASLIRGDKSAPTDVCTVLPHLRSYEQWPYPVDRIDLREFALVPYQAGTYPVCG